MSAFDRLERKIDKLEQSIEKKKEKIHELEHKFEDHLIAERKFHAKKKRLLSKIRDMDSEVRILKGGLVRKKHKFDKKAK
jgi:predicted RNase H-like nuclease (RuvC/YqgF family)